VLNQNKKIVPAGSTNSTVDILSLTANLPVTFKTLIEEAKKDSLIQAVKKSLKGMGRQERIVNQQIGCDYNSFTIS
jgi:hypothetical protein